MSGGDSKLKRGKLDISPDEASDFAGVAAALGFLDNRTNVEAMRPANVDVARVFTLDRMRALMAALGEPQRSYKCVHVAGSKGKGSVCEMVASSLEACGYTVGLYTSPHLVDIFERVRINQMKITAADFSSVLSRVARAEATIDTLLGPATYFELLTACALVHFADQAVDLAVIEVGLGGLTDATNIIMPEVSAIAAIHKEHTNILGTTLAEIAAAKAGILKPGVPGVTVPQVPEVMQVLRAAATAAGTTLEALGEEIEYSARV
ncbi:MAG: Mur ligase family protein, partial [Phycisphaerales bacterium]